MKFSIKQLLSIEKQKQESNDEIKDKQTFAKSTNLTLSSILFQRNNENVEADNLDLIGLRAQNMFLLARPSLPRFLLTTPHPMNRAGKQYQCDQIGQFIGLWATF